MILGLSYPFPRVTYISFSNGWFVC